MSDNIQLARRARTELAQALNALQLDEVPEHIQELAATVARVMSLLHGMETRGGDANTANEALTTLRQALNRLQAPENAHPATETALEAVAGSLGLVHQLASSFGPGLKPRAATHDPTPVDPRPHALTPPSNVRAPSAQQATETPLAIAATQVAPAPQAVLAPPVAPAAPVAPAPEVAAPSPNAERRTTGAVAGETSPKEAKSTGVDSTDAKAAPVAEEPIPLSRVSSPPAAPSTAPAYPAERTSDAPKRISNNPVSLPALPAQPGETFVEAALGAYSTTNFYKGLSGNDVIDAGGLFIATYAPPEMGQEVRVQVSLPGGFEFQARGVVSWVREMPKTGSLNPMTPPGFGVRFTEISKEARQLVYRYVRNREPLFYDDL